MTLSTTDTLSIVTTQSPLRHAEKPLRTPGYIQPHGVLLVFQEHDLKIVQVSDNSRQVLGELPQALLQSPLSQLFAEEQLRKITAALKAIDLAVMNPLKLSIQVRRQTVQFDGILHRSAGLVLLELEPSQIRPEREFLAFYHRINLTIQKLHQAADLQQLCEVAADEIRQLTHLDRVMIYRFSAKGDGRVIAESKHYHLDSFLGLDFPSFDIPLQARDLFLEAGIRLIADVKARPAQLVPPNDTALDLSQVGLRGVSPCHIQYLKNMGVSASLSIPLVYDGLLWGLVVCHGYTPKTFAYEVRTACTLLGKVLSSELSSQKSHEDYDYELHLNDCLNQLTEILSATTNIDRALFSEPELLLQLTNATGVVIWHNGDSESVGTVPPRSQLEPLIKAFQDYPSDDLIHTNSLVRSNLPVTLDKEIASGFLAISLSETQPHYIIWFRPEVVQTIRWAGNPNEEPVPLTPRTSFALWQEQVKETCLPWQEGEIEVALKFRAAIQRIALRRADRLAQLNQALQASETRERQKAAELAQALAKLQSTHTQLVQSEKMSSLGQLVAGVAHEINNPVSFIYGNLVHTARYVQDLISVIEQYQQEHPHPSTDLQAHVEEVDLDFMLADLPKLFQSMRSGANRIQEIVKSLRTFSRLDESDSKPVDIHKGINSTLVILGNRLKARQEQPAIEVVKNYGEIPEVDCFPGLLNQVFMNLLMNAIDALNERDQARSLAQIANDPSTMTLTTAFLNDPHQPHIQIQLTDNGLGIHPEHRENIFDPFFTTKPVGKGTGMGLAISYQIITEKHGGTLTCNSQVGEGTTFTICLPHIQRGS
ncbi:MAG: GAF domain-containing protein [Spirulina sp. SIO3F2]|nr:GAF domain-containing protein [Spirulina sp. SIO3F2]